MPMIGFTPRSRAGLVEVEDSVHVAVVGDADCGLLVSDRGFDHVVDAGRTVEHRELGVQVEVDERVPQGRVPFSSRSGPFRPPGDRLTRV